MKDKISISHAEAIAEITCAVCDEMFYTFPSTPEDIFFECPKCGRHFRFCYEITPLTIDQVREYKARYRKE